MPSRQEAAMESREGAGVFAPDGRHPGAVDRMVAWPQVIPATGWVSEQCV